MIIIKIANAFMKDRISKSIAKHSQTPKEKYDMPLTSNQEIGWYSKPLVRFKLEMLIKNFS